MVSLPFKIYEVGNLASVPSNVFVGKTFIADDGSNTRTKENCYSTFLFASIVGGKNIRVDQPTEKDPYIFIDAKFFNFKPFEYYIDSLNGMSNDALEVKYSPNNTEAYQDTLIQSISQSDNGDVLFMVKTLGTDGGLTILDNGQQLELRAGIYKAENIIYPEKVPLYTHTSKDIFGNNIFHINKLIEGSGILFEQILEFEWDDVVNLFSSSSSLSSLSSVSISSSSTSNSSTSNSSSSTSSLSSVSDQSSQSEECCADCCADCQVYDIQFEVAESAGAFIDFAEVWSTFDRYSWGTPGDGHGANGSAQWMVTADQHLNGGAIYRSPIAYRARNNLLPGQTTVTSWIVQNFPGNDTYTAQFGSQIGTKVNPYYVNAKTPGYSQTFNFQNGDSDGWTYFHVDGAIGVTLETSDTTDTLMEVYLNSDYTGLIGTYDFVRESDGVSVTFKDKAKLDFTSNGTYFVRICEFNTYSLGSSAPNSNFSLFAKEELFPDLQPKIKTDMNQPQASSMISPDGVTFNNYRYSLVLSANENDYDNDLIGFVLAVWEDENELVVDPYTGESHPRMHTLSAVRIFTTQDFITTNPVWCIIYDLTQNTEQIIARDDTPNTGLGPNSSVPTWFNYPKGTRIQVEKSGNIFTAQCTDLADDPDNPGSLGYKIIVDVSNGSITTYPSGVETTITSPYASLLSPFVGPTKVGFVALSNEFSTFTLNSCEVDIEASYDDTCQLCQPDPKTIAETRVVAEARISCLDAGDSRGGLVLFPDNVYTPAKNEQGGDIAYFEYVGAEAIDAENAIVRYRLFQVFDSAKGNKVTSMSIYKFPESTSHTLSINAENYNLINAVTTTVNPDDLPDDCHVQTIGETEEAFWTGFLDTVMVFDITMNRSGIGGVTDTYSFSDNSVFVWDKTFNIDSNNRKILFKIIDPKQSNKQVGSLTFVVTECITSDVSSPIGDLLIYQRSCNCGPIFESVESLSSDSSSSSNSSNSSNSSSSSSSCVESLECLKPDEWNAEIEVDGRVLPVSGGIDYIPDGVDFFDIFIPRVEEDGIQYDPYQLYVKGTPWGTDYCDADSSSSGGSSSSSSSSSDNIPGLSIVRIDEHTWRVFIGECIEQTVFFRWNIYKKGVCTTEQILFDDEFIVMPPIEIPCPSSSSQSESSESSSSPNESSSSSSSNSSSSESSSSNSSSSESSSSDSSDSSSSGAECGAGDNCSFFYSDFSTSVEDIGSPGELVLRVGQDSAFLNGFVLQCDFGDELPSIEIGGVSITGVLTVNGTDYSIDDGSFFGLSYIEALVPCSEFPISTLTMTYTASYVSTTNGCTYSDSTTNQILLPPDIADGGDNQTAYETACI